jgi:hypothetical protein
MRDATAMATAEKLFDACGPSWAADTYAHWKAAVKAWAVGSTRSLHDKDLDAIVYRILMIEEAREEFDRRCLEAYEFVEDL